MKFRHLRFILLLAVPMSLAGCETGDVSLTLEMSETPTQIFVPSVTLASRPVSSFETPTPSGTKTPTPTPTVTATTTAFLQGEEMGCSNRAEFVKDLSIPDGTQLKPSDTFVKSWRLRNSGTCTWTREYVFFFMGGEPMDAYEVLPMPENVAPGESVDLSAAMTAPSQAGSYESDWLLRDENGAPFGIGPLASSPFWVRIEVRNSVPTGKATPFADTPAAGICGGIDGTVITMTINPDMPDPRCVVVRPDQLLRVVNGRGEDITATLFNLSATIAPGADHTFEKTFGELLLPGVHGLNVSPCCGGTLWLKGP